MIFSFFDCFLNSKYLTLFGCFSTLTISEVLNYITCSKLVLESVEYWVVTESTRYLYCFPIALKVFVN